MINQNNIDNSISFKSYFELMETLAKEGNTTGQEKSESRIDFTKLNFSRMKRILKTTPIAPEVIDTVECLNDKLTWVVLTESWCGDAAQNIPILAKVAEANPAINLRILLRDDNPTVMNQYLTNNSKSIPKLICLDENLEELGTWGPRPKHLQDWMIRNKENPVMSMDDLKKEFQVWYTQDKGQTLQKELILLLKAWENRDCLCIV